MKLLIIDRREWYLDSMYSEKMDSINHDVIRYNNHGKPCVVAQVEECLNTGKCKGFCPTVWIWDMDGDSVKDVITKMTQDIGFQRYLEETLK